MRTPLLGAVAQHTRREGRALNDEVNSADVRFVLQGDVVQLTQVDMQSSDLRLIGEGSWDMRADTIDMTLVGANPRNWPRVAILSDVVELAGREFMQYRLTGPAKSPRLAVEPLHNLTEPLRRILAGIKP